jgi:hypothetical protein
MDWTYLAHDCDQWSALVNTVMNLSGSIKCWEVAASQEGLSSMSSSISTVAVWKPVKYPYRNPTSRRRRRKEKVCARGYSWETLSLVDMHTETWSSTLGVRLKAGDLAL